MSGGRTSNPVNIESAAFYIMTGATSDDEIRRRAKAEEGAGKLVAGAGSCGKPKKLAHMISVRLEPEMVVKARAFARAHNVTISDVLREGLRRL